MRRFFIVALVGLLVGALAPIVKSDVTVLSIARVKVTTAEQGNYLMTAFDETHNHAPGVVEVLLWPGDQARLDALGYDYDIVIEDVYKHDQQMLAQADLKVVPLPGPDRADYRVLTDYNTEMAELAEKNPKLVKLLTLPHKTTEGRDVFGLEIANNVKSDDGRPVLYVDGIHHAREWPAGEYPMIYAHYLVENFGKDAAVTRLLSQGRVIIVPIVNVDGFDYSRSSVTGTRLPAEAGPAEGQPDAVVGSACGLGHCESYWRKNRRSYSGVTVPVVQKNPDAYGVDPNRNYSYHWGGGGSTNQDLGLVDNTNRGDEPFSEPESRNVRDTVLASNVTALVSNHTSGRLVLRAWGDTYVNQPDEKYQKALGARLSKAMGGYQNLKGIQLYVTTGTTSDWGYGALGIPSYTFEHGAGFHPPYTGCNGDCVGTHWKKVVKAFMELGEAALDERIHGIVKGKVPGGAKLTVTKKYGAPLDPANPLSEKTWPEKFESTIQTSPNGSFEWHLPPSTRPAVRFNGDVEKYTLTVSGKGGKKTYTFELKQGRVLNLGTIRL